MGDDEGGSSDGGGGDDEVGADRKGSADDEGGDGFSDPEDPAAQIKLMDDATLLSAYRALSNPKVLLQTSRWFELLENEIHTRGLMPMN